MIVYPLKKKALFLFAVLFASAIFCPAEEPAKNELSAKENSSEKPEVEKLVVSLTFLPITSFDDAGNQRMSEKLAAVFLQEDVSRHFKSQKAVDLSKVEKNEKKKTGQEWSLTYTVPASAISDETGKSVSEEIKVIRKYVPSEAVNSALREPKAVFVRDLKIAEAIFFGQINGGETISEQELTTAFDAFEKKVNDDDSMFLSDKDGLLSQAKSVRDFLLKKMADKSESAETGKQPSAAITKANMLPEYEPLLMSNPILLESGGWSVFRTEDGSLYLVVVGTAAVKNDSAEDRIQRQKIAEAYAYSELAKIPGMDLKTFSQHFVSETAKNDQVELIDSFQSKVVSAAEDHVMGLPTVGTWYSSDGKIYYRALGRKL